MVIIYLAERDYYYSCTAHAPLLPAAADNWPSIPPGTECAVRKLAFERAAQLQPQRAPHRELFDALQARDSPRCREIAAGP